jgi:hypothetical protein
MKIDGIWEQEIEWDGVKVANTWKGNVGGHTLSQDLSHYIGSKDVVVWTDNVTLKYFAIQPKLSSK